MNNLLNTIKINETDLPIIEYDGERVLNLKLIDQIHGRPEGSSKRNFNANEKYFIENEDFFMVCRYEFRTDIWENLGFHTKASNGILLSQTGYLLLVKSFTDDLAWKIQRELVRHYFKTIPGKEQITPKDYRSIRARISNLVSRIAKVTDAMEFKTLWEEIRDLSVVISHPLPDLTLLGKDHQQLVLPGFE